MRTQRQRLQPRPPPPPAPQQIPVQQTKRPIQQVPVQPPQQQRNVRPVQRQEYYAPQQPTQRVPVQRQEYIQQQGNKTTYYDACSTQPQIEQPISNNIMQNGKMTIQGAITLMSLRLSNLEKQVQSSKLNEMDGITQEQSGDNDITINMLKNFDEKMNVMDKEYKETNQDIYKEINELKNELIEIKNILMQPYQEETIEPLTEEVQVQEENNDEKISIVIEDNVNA